MSLTREKLLQALDGNGSLLRIFSSQETSPPPDTPKRDIAKGNIIPLKEGHPQMSLSGECIQYGNAINRVAIIFYNYEKQALKVKEIVKLLNRSKDDYGSATIEYDTAKRAAYQLKKYGLIRRLPHGFYILIDRERMRQFIEGEFKREGVPLRGSEPCDENTLDISAQKGTSPPPLQKFHNMRFRGVQLGEDKFKQLKLSGSLIQPRVRDRARQWIYNGRGIRIFIPETTRRCWGSIFKDGWEPETITEFGPEFYSQIVTHSTVECAIEGREENYRFSATGEPVLSLHRDNGSQLGVPEVEVHGPAEQVETARMLLTDPIRAVNMLDRIMGHSAALADAYLDIRERQSEILLILSNKQDRMENVGGIDYHQ